MNRPIMKPLDSIDLNVPLVRPHLAVLAHSIYSPEAVDTGILLQSWKI